MCWVFKMRFWTYFVVLMSAVGFGQLLFGKTAYHSAVAVKEYFAFGPGDEHPTLPIFRAVAYDQSIITEGGLSAVADEASLPVALICCDSHKKIKAILVSGTLAMRRHVWGGVQDCPLDLSCLLDCNPRAWEGFCKALSQALKHQRVPDPRDGEFFEKIIEMSFAPGLYLWNVATRCVDFFPAGLP